MMRKRLIKPILVLVVPLIFAVYGLATLADYGLNWDEPYHFRRGQAFLHFYLTGQRTYEGMPKYPPLKGTADSGSFRNSRELFEAVQKNPSLSDSNFRRSYYQDDAWDGVYHIDLEDAAGHPALGGILAAAFNKIFYQKLGILGDLESYHLFEVFLASLLVLGVAWFMWRQFGIVESVVSSLALATYPLFLGEQHFNVKDPPVAAFYTFTLIATFLAVTRKSTGWLAMAILTFAIGLSIKFNIVFIVFPLAFWALFYFRKNKVSFKFPKKFYLLLGLSPFIILSLFILLFPTLWKNPLGGIVKVIGYYLTVGYSQSQPASYYLFGFINTYPLIWIFYTTPLPTLVLSFLIFFFPGKLTQNQGFPLLLLASLAVTIGRISLFGALSYGGVRIITEFVPVLAMLCGIATGYVGSKIKDLRSKIWIFLLLLTSYILHLTSLSRIHPNENVYFNEIAGGLAGAKEKQINSWGNSNGNAYIPAIAWLNANAVTNARLTIPVGSISNIPRYKLRPDISLSADYWSGPANFGEYVLELTYDYPPMNWFSLKYLNTALVPVYENKVDGVAIAKLWKNSPEYLLPEFANQKETAAKISQKENYLELTLPRPEKIMKITLTQPAKNCAPLTTGYLAASLDGKNWIREPEDLARDQLKHAKLKELEEKFEFYLVARQTKYLRLYPENTDACILNANKAQVTVLTGN